MLKTGREIGTGLVISCYGCKSGKRGKRGKRGTRAGATPTSLVSRHVDVGNNWLGPSLCLRLCLAVAISYRSGAIATTTAATVTCSKKKQVPFASLA